MQYQLNNVKEREVMFKSLLTKFMVVFRKEIVQEGIPALTESKFLSNCFSLNEFIACFPVECMLLKIDIETSAQFETMAKMIIDSPAYKETL